MLLGALAAVLPRGLGADEKATARDLTPGSFKALLESLEDRVQGSPEHPRMAFVDFSQHGVYRKVWDKFAKAGLKKGVVMARLDCAEHFDFCSSKLEVQPWTDMRLYFPGDRPRANDHVQFPAGLLTRQNTNQGGEGLEYVKQFLNSLDKDSAQELSNQWRASIKSRASVEVDAEGNIVSDGLTRVTGETLESVMATAIHNPVGQVFMLYSGTYEDCRKEVNAMKRAAEELKEELKSSITLAVANCDVHPEPCEAASIGVYCFANHFSQDNACPHNIGGPKGSAIFDDDLTTKRILRAIKKGGASHEEL